MNLPYLSTHLACNNILQVCGKPIFNAMLKHISQNLLVAHFQVKNVRNTEANFSTIRSSLAENYQFGPQEQVDLWRKKSTSHFKKLYFVKISLNLLFLPFPFFTIRICPLLRKLKWTVTKMYLKKWRMKLETTMTMNSKCTR